MHFAKEMLKSKGELESLGAQVYVPIDTEECVENPELNMSLEHCESFEVDLDKDHYNKISDSEAIVVLNYPKNGVENYIGGATLMEIGVARHMDKKIFLLNEIPKKSDLRYALEIELAKPIILDGELKNIKKYINL